MKLNKPLETPAEISTALGLTGLFVLGGTADLSRFNHATGTSGTVVGSPTYNSNSVTFPVNSYIDTGIAETTNLTLAGSSARDDTFRGIVHNVNGETDVICGLSVNNFGRKLYFIASGNRVGAALDFALATTSANEAAKSTDNAIFGIGCWPFTGTSARLWEPRYRNETATGAMSGAGRVVFGTNYRIGWVDTSVASTTIHLVAIADYAMNDEQQTDLFVWCSKFLNRRGVYL